MEDKTIPYIVYEDSQVRHERNMRRLIIALVISIFLIFASNAAWLYAWCQYDYSSETSIIRQNTSDGGDVNFIRNGGEINNGASSGSDSKKTTP